MAEETISFAERKHQIQKHNYFGETLKKHRKAKGLTQKQAADRIEATQALWSSYELGKSRPDLDTAIALALVVEADPIEFLKECIEELQQTQTHIL